MRRDLLLLLRAGHSDAGRCGERSECPHCELVEALLAADSARAAARLDVRRLAYARPRAIVVDAHDREHQGLPVLIFGDGPPPPADARKLGRTAFVNDPDRILALLVERHGFPIPPRDD